MKRSYWCILAVLMMSLSGAPALATSSPDSTQGRVDSESDLATPSVGRVERSERDLVVGLLLAPGMAKQPISPAGEMPLPSPVPPAPLGGKATPWVLAGLIAAAFVTFVIIAASASPSS
jgi:hypothetical protein